MYFRRVAFLCCFFNLLVPASAQVPFGLYHAAQIPQQNLLNPAFRSNASVIFGLPGLSATGVQYYNSSFTLNQLVQGINVSGDSATLNLNKTVSLFGNRNYLSAKAEQQWFFAAFRTAKSQLTFHVSEHMQVRFKYPKDLFRLLIEGNGGANLGNTFNLKFSLNAIHYREFAVAYSREIKDKFIFGGRMKFLKGFTLFDAAKMALNINTAEHQYDLTATSNINIHAASTAYALGGGPNNPQVLDFFRGSRNPGMALDLGIVWREHPRLTLSAAILDFGFINWKNNAIQLKSKNPSASFRYQGLPLNPGKEELGNYVQNLKDSIYARLGFDTIKGSFSLALNSHLLCGVQYFLNAKTSIQTLVYTDFFNSGFHPALHAGIRWQPCYWLYLMAHNTSFNNIWLNPGVGLSIHAGKTLFYASTEHLMGITAADKSRSLSIKFGVNIMWNKDERSMKRIKDPEVLFMQQRQHETSEWGR